MKKKGNVLWLFVAIFWAGVIFLLSSKTGAESNETSSSLASVLSSFLAPNFSSWAPSEQAEWLAGINNLLRKLAHFFEYGLLGALAYLAVKSLSGKFRRKKQPSKLMLGMISFYICAAISALDEMLQISSSGRTSSPGDILIDCAGVILGIIICSHKTKLPASEPQQKTAVRRRG